MTASNNHNGVMTLDEVAELHRVSRRTVERWAANGVLPVSKLPGGQVRVEEKDARRLLKPVTSSSAGSRVLSPPDGVAIPAVEEPTGTTRGAAITPEPVEGAAGAPAPAAHPSPQ